MLPFLLIFLTGFTTSIGQILVLRELLVLFYGNELSTGLVLACWMLWTAAGSRIAGRAWRSGPPGPATLIAGTALLSLSLPATILWTRAARTVWGVPAGELISPGSMFAIALCSTGLFCFVSGALFALCWSHAAAYAARGESGDATGVYLAEAAGAGAGGLFYYFLLLPTLPPFSGSALLCILVAACSCAAVLAAQSKFSGKVPAIVFALTVVLVNCSLLFFTEEIDLAARRLQWGKGFLESRDTPYHNLAFLERSGQYSLFCNGLWLCSIPDPQTAEPAAHLPLLQHPHPQKVLLIGDFSPGLIAEILKHPGIHRLDCVQPDSEMLDFAERILPPSFLGYSADPRLNIHHSDPKRFMASSEGGYSVIIMGAGEPVNAEMNRFYTVEFFSGAKDLLEEGGVFSFGMPSSPNIIGRREAALLGSLKKTLGEVFGSVAAVHGDSTYFFAGKPGSVIKDPDILVERLRLRSLDLQYLRDFHIIELFNPLRLAYIDSVLGEESGRVNRDFQPVCYLFALNLWSAQLHPAIGRSFEWLIGEGRGWLPAVPIAAIFALALISRAKSGPRGAVALNTAVSGAVLIVLEIVLILASQIIGGAMYREIALIISLFMAGLALGGGIGRKIAGRSENKLLILFLAQAAIAAYSVLLIAGLQILKGFQANSIGAVFSLLALLAGMLGGFQFAAAVRVKANSGFNSAGGDLYAADLVGSAAGAVFASLLLLPVTGIPNTLLIAALAELAGSTGLLGKN